MEERAQRLRAAGTKIVFTNGCFDILHAGHATYIAEARALGDFLIVGVNTDESVRRLKGLNRPVNALADRMTMLASLEAVDAVTWFGEDTPHELIRKVRPDIHAKGGDYRVEDLGEATLVEELGGKVVVLRLVPGRSTTALIQRLGGG